MCLMKLLSNYERNSQYFLSVFKGVSLTSGTFVWTNQDTNILMSFPNRRCKKRCENII